MTNKLKIYLLLNRGNPWRPALIRCGGKQGYVALMSAIIIAFVLVTITVTLNFVAFYGRFNVLDSEFKETSMGLAEACADMAMLELVKGNAPVAGTIINVGANQCTIVSIAGPTPAIIKTRAIYKNSYTNLRISFTPATANINSWEECPNTCP